MGTVPAPNIAEMGMQIAQAPANTFAEYARAANLRQQTALAQQQTQGAALENQQRQQAITNQKAIGQAMLGWDGKDPGELSKAIITHGGTADAAMNTQKHFLDVRTQASTLDKDNLANLKMHNDAALGAFHSLDSVADEDLPNAVLTTAHGLLQSGHIQPQDFQQVQQMAGLPGSELRQHLAIWEKGHQGYDEQFKQADDLRKSQVAKQEADTKQQEANAKDWQKDDQLGMFFNTRTGEVKTPMGQMVSPAMLESKYVQLAAKKAAGQPLAPEDTAFMKGVERYKTLVPQFTINQNTTGAGLIPGAGQPGGQGGAPPTIENVPASIAGRVKQIIDYRGPMPPAGRNNPVNTAISYWVNQLDPQHDETNYGARNKMMTNITSGALGKQLNATNTALGHIKVLNDAIDALNNNSVPMLNAIANKLGIAIGDTPATTFKTIVHRVGPELASAYIEGGGGEHERGTTAADFSENAAPAQLKANAAITAQLLRSKIGATEQQYKTTMRREDFQDRFLTPEAKATLAELSPAKSADGKAISVKAPNGKTYNFQDQASADRFKKAAGIQ
jgi:hypothetical protein